MIIDLRCHTNSSSDNHLRVAEIKKGNSRGMALGINGKQDNEP
jgi:hypothetical protein